MFILNEDEMKMIVSEMAVDELYDANGCGIIDSHNKHCFSCSSACQNYAKQK